MVKLVKNKIIYIILVVIPIIKVIPDLMYDLRY